MKISLDWLGDLVSWEDTPEQLAVKLTAAGLNVEGIETYSQTYPGVVIASVLECGRHPDADRLSLCKVDDGSGQPVQVVCGAPNVREGLTVLFARVGAVLPGDFKIKKTKIRGVESMGMICSGSELELSTDSSGIIELETELPVGTPADELHGFEDTVLEIEVTPNRPDWLSHIGVAREVAAIYGTKASLPPVWNFQQSGESLGTKVRIGDYEECPRYTAYGVKGLKIGPSPDWMQNRLRATGSRPINNVVDITNYVMFELGQPMHAFDRAKLAGDTITIKTLDHETKVTTLDDQERKIPAGTLLVCDEDGPVALAGVMGLANSEVTEDSSEILLESAFFEPGLVRTASRGLGLISESSYRFERGADWEMVERAALRALQLFHDLAEGRIIPDWADRADPDRSGFSDVPLRVWQVNRLLGAEISTDLAAQYLQSLGLKVQPMGNPGQISANAVNMMVKVPSYRRDLFQEVDLIEEIARCHGFDNLDCSGDFRIGSGVVREPVETLTDNIRTWLSVSGFHEIVTSSFMKEGDLDRMQLPEDDPRRRSLSVINPHHGGETALRTTILPALLEVACRNINAGANLPVRLFQINRAYWPTGSSRPNPIHEDESLLPAEPVFLQVAIAGVREQGLGGVPADLLELKGAVEGLSGHLRIPLTLDPDTVEGWFGHGCQWAVKAPDGQTVGSAGGLDPKLLENFDIEVPLAVVEIEISRLDPAPAPLKYVPFTRYPAVKRDLSLLVPDGTTYSDLVDQVRSEGGDHLDTVDLFDIYRGQGVAEGFAAYGIRLKFRSAKGNLKGKTVDRAITAILAGLSSRLKIEARG